MWNKELLFFVPLLLTTLVAADVDPAVAVPTASADVDPAVEVPTDQLPIVQTAQGAVRGLRERLPTGQQVDRYLGIPFAKPPTGDLRFRHPVPADKWEQVFDADDHPDSCEQENLPASDVVKQLKPLKIRTVISEDCLKLNVWVPVPNPSKAAVMIWIYGGAFQTGSCALQAYSGMMLASQEEVIVVCLNYRVGALGFMYLDHPDMPGNAGLYDQFLGVQWVKENIASFGGDPEKLTVFGESAGSSSVGYLFASPLNQNLIKRAIMQSGNPTSVWASTRKDRVFDLTLEIAKETGCPKGNGSVSEVIQCLKMANSVTILDNQLPVAENLVGNFSPVPDGNLVPATWKEHLKSEDFANRSVLFGNTKNEASLIMFFNVLDPSSLLKPEPILKPESFKTIVNLFLPGDELIEQAAKFFYNASYERNDFQTTEEMMSDALFVCESQNFVEQLVGAGCHAYSYVMEHVNSQREWPSWMGSTHSDDVPLVLGEPLDPGRGYSAEDLAVSKMMMRMWANFARTGNPNTNPDGTRLDARVSWPPYTLETKEYAKIHSSGFAASSAHKSRNCQFWNQHVKKLIEIKNRLRCGDATVV